jgi:predicted O-methyltransferase YrrM
VYASESAWRDVDRYFIDQLVAEDDVLVQARASAHEAGWPLPEVAPNQGKFLALIAEMIGARRVLEFGTFAGYSTIWLARAVGATGRVTTLEIDPERAALARENFRRAGLESRIEVIVGPALKSAHALIAAADEPYDLAFIDADKPNNAAYLAAAVSLLRPGGVVIGDNVVRDGEVVNAASPDDRVQGVRAFVAALSSDPRLSATAIQTVGGKGWDGFSIAVVR